MGFGFFVSQMFVPLTAILCPVLFRCSHLLHSSSTAYLQSFIWAQLGWGSQTERLCVLFCCALCRWQGPG